MGPADMWCYQNPDFEALLITELQRQQQYSQFCDTLLEAEGVLVPVHSCILSAFSPCISSALASALPPPPGQKHLLKFGTLRACTLLHIVRLLYSGEMEGEGEKEKQEALSAAAKLGIHGLLEVTKRAWRCRHGEGGGQCVEVAVQTEPEEKTVNRGRWRRELRDGDVCLWKETVSEGGKDVWTQTEVLQIDMAPPPQPAPSYQTIDIDVFQSLGQAGSQLVPPQIVPISIVYPADGNKADPPLVSLQDPSAGGHPCVSAAALQPTSSPPSLPRYSNHMTPCGAEPRNGWSTCQAVAEDEECEHFEQFEGNIPGFISYFFDPHKGEGSGRRRAGRRRGRGRGGARRGETGVRKPRGGRRGGRGRETLTQTVDMQEIRVVGQLRKQFLHRSGGRVGRMGQGGGAAGRRLQTKTRELLNSGSNPQRRRVRLKVWEVNQTGDLQLCRKVGRGGRGQRERRSSTPWQDDTDTPPALQPQRSSVSFARSPVRVLHFGASPAPGSALLCSSAPRCQQPAAPYMCPAASLLHTCPLPAPACPPHDDQPEHIDRLLEEVMMGLDIIPTGSSTPRPARSSAAALSGDTLSLSKPLCHTDALRRSADVVREVRETDVSCPAEGAAPVLQQEAEGEMNKMLDQFLQSFERHVERTWVEGGVSEEGCTGSSSSSSSTTRNRHAVTHTPHLQDPRASQHLRPPEGATWGHSSSLQQSPDGQLIRRQQKKKETVKKMSSRDFDMRMVDRKGAEQLQQMPVVKLKRSLLLPAGMMLLDSSCQSLTQKVRAETDAAAADNTGKKWSLFGGRKTYPTRSRFKEMSRSNNVPVIEPLKKEPLSSAGLSGGRRGRPNGLHVNPSSSNQNRKESTDQAQVEAKQPKKRGRKRKVVSNGTPGDAVAPIKRVCVDQTAQLVCKTASPRSESAEFFSEPATTEPEEIIDIETVSLTSVGDESQDQKPTFFEITPAETEECLMDEQSIDGSSEIIDVEMLGGATDEEMSRTTPAPEFSPGSPPASSSKEEEEDIDVVGGSGPTPEPLVLSWTDCSDAEKEEGDEDGDVKESTEWASSASQVRNSFCFYE